MLQVCILALLLFGSISVMRAGEGDIMLLEKLEKIARGEKSAEGTISFMVIALSAIMGLNAPAILTVGASFAKPLSKKSALTVPRTCWMHNPTLWYTVCLGHLQWFTRWDLLRTVQHR